MIQAYFFNPLAFESGGFVSAYSSVPKNPPILVPIGQACYDATGLEAEQPNS